MQKGRFSCLFLVSLLGLTHLNTVFAETVSPQKQQQINAFAQSKEVQQFIQKMVDKHQFSVETLKAWFLKATPNTRVIELMDTPAENLTWHAYHDRVITPDRIQQGVLFLKNNQPILKKVSAQFGVSSEILVAVLGLESAYGNITGKFSVFETLATLAFQYPRRAAFFKSELTHFLLLSREEGFDPLSVKGSYAGAMGPAQFMPSNYRTYAIDFAQSGRRNILDNMPNIIGSVANFLKSHGWKAGQPVAHRAKVSGTQHQQLQIPNKNISNAATLAEWAKIGVKINEPRIPKRHDPKTTTAKLVTLEGKEGPAHWIAYPNFEVIKRYNNSTHYAMAVYLLGKQITEEALKR